MRFNPSKYHIMSMRTTKRFTKFYVLCSCILSHVSHPKYLGTTLSIRTYNGNIHVSSLEARAYQTFTFPCRKFKGCSTDLEELAYSSLINSKFRIYQHCRNMYQDKKKKYSKGSYQASYARTELQHIFKQS